MKIANSIIQGLSAVKKSRRRRAREPIARSAHDRTASNLVRGAMVEPVEIADPYEEGGKIVALRSYRDDPLAKLKRDGHIDDAHYAAGLCWQRDYEAAQGASAVKAFVLKESVDGAGPTPDPITDRQQKAVKKLGECDRALGQLGSQLIRLYLGYRLPASHIAERFGSTGKAEKDYYGRRVRECLETLVGVYNLKSA